jgi:hypothetical protein
MAEHGSMEVDRASGVDYEDHRRTYIGFLRATRWGVIAIVVLLIFLAWYHG